MTQERNGTGIPHYRKRGMEGGRLAGGLFGFFRIALFLINYMFYRKISLAFVVFLGFLSFFFFCSS